MDAIGLESVRQALGEWKDWWAGCAAAWEWWLRPARWVLNTLMALGALGALAMIAGGVLQRPVLLGAIPSGSMEPGMRAGDLALIVPVEAAPLLAPVVGEIDDGAVVVFRSDGRRWIVHRIVGGDAASGYVTKGDANEASDSARIAPEDIVGVVPQWGGGPVRLPGFARLTTSLAFLRHPAVAAIAGLGSVAALLFGGRSTRTLRRKRPKAAGGEHALLYGGLALTTWTVVTLQSVVTTVPIDGHFTVVQSSRSALIEGEVLAGTVRSETLRLDNPFPVPVAVVVTVASEGVTAEPDRMIVAPRSAAEHRLSISGHLPPGRHALAVRRAFYLPVLPLDLLVSLGRVSPLLAAAAVGLVPGTVVLLVAAVDRDVRRAVRVWLLRAWLRVSA